MARHQRIMSPTKIYHIMMRGNEKKNIFLDDEDRQRFINTLNVKKSENKFELYAYCLMDNHIHLLLNEKDESIAKIMKCINVSYAMYFNWKYRRVGHFFQDRFKSEVIDTDDYLLSAAHYIHYNPVKAGMVEYAGDYPWSSYKDYINIELEGFLVDKAFILKLLSEDREKAVKRFIELKNNQNEVNFCDIQDEVDISTRLEALAIIKQHLALDGLTYDDLINQKGRIKGSIKHRLVKILKGKTNLGSRELGSLLGMSKSTVNKLFQE